MAMANPTQSEVFIDYADFFLPNDSSAGLRARNRGAATDDKASDAKSFGLVCPAMYAPSTAEAAQRA